jgi:DNA-binding response OmpR family regulator
MGRVVVVEDDEDIRMLIVRRLERAGHEVRSAADGVDGLELIRDRMPDLVVLDWMMPRLDGLGVAEQLAADEGPRPRILMLTARDQQSDLDRALAAGVDDFLGKPFLAPDLLAAVDALLGVS